jgi:hypothetical protein
MKSCEDFNRGWRVKHDCVLHETVPTFHRFLSIFWMRTIHNLPNWSYIQHTTHLQYTYTMYAQAIARLISTRALADEDMEFQRQLTDAKSMLEERRFGQDGYSLMGKLPWTKWEEHKNKVYSTERFVEEYELLSKHYADPAVIFMCMGERLDLIHVDFHMVDLSKYVMIFSLWNDYRERIIPRLVYSTYAGIRRFIIRFVDRTGIGIDAHYFSAWSEIHESATECIASEFLLRFSMIASRRKGSSDAYTIVGAYSMNSALDFIENNGTSNSYRDPIKGLLIKRMNNPFEFDNNNHVINNNDIGTFRVNMMKAMYLNENLTMNIERPRAPFRPFFIHEQYEGFANTYVSLCHHLNVRPAYDYTQVEIATHRVKPSAMPKLLEMISRFIQPPLEEVDGRQYYNIKEDYGDLETIMRNMVRGDTEEMLMLQRLFMLKRRNDEVYSRKLTPSQIVDLCTLIDENFTASVDDEFQDEKYDVSVYENLVQCWKNII